MCTVCEIKTRSSPTIKSKTEGHGTAELSNLSTENSNAFGGRDRCGQSQGSKAEKMKIQKQN